MLLKSMFLHFLHHRTCKCRMENLTDLFFKEQGGTGRKKLPETILPDYERGLCDNGDMFCGYGYAIDDVGNTMNKRLMVFVAFRRFLVKKYSR